MLAIVLARKNWREFDQMISLYTRERGKVEVLAKGIKKITSKNSSNLEILSLAEIDIAQGKEIDYLTKVQSIRIFKNIYSDFDKIFIASYAVKIADANILTQERDERIFNLLTSFLEFLDSAAKINSLNLATGFIFKLWHCLGFSAQEEKHEVWLRGDWPVINSLDSTQEKSHQFVYEFAQAHSGRKLAKFVSPW